MNSIPIVKTIAISDVALLIQSSSALGAMNPVTTKEIKITIPDCANSITFTFSIIDPDGITRYSIVGIAENASTIILVERTLRTGYTFGLTPSAESGTWITATISVDAEA